MRRAECDLLDRADRHRRQGGPEERDPLRPGGDQEQPAVERRPPDPVEAHDVREMDPRYLEEGHVRP